MKYDAIILAGGYSSRIGTNKMELLIDNKPVLYHVVDIFKPLCEHIIVVGGHYYGAILEMFIHDSKVKVVENENYELGMFSSILRGVSEVTNDFFITPGDYPMISHETVKELINEYGEIIVPTFNGYKGHPILIRKELRQSLLNEPIDSNLKAFRNKYKLSLVPVNDEGILLDIDTLPEYNELKRKIERGVI